MLLTLTTATALLACGDVGTSPVADAEVSIVEVDEAIPLNFMASSTTAFGITPASAVIDVGTTVELTLLKPSGAKILNARWSSSSPTIATVKNGVVTGRMPGTAAITAQTKNGAAVAAVTVVAPASAPVVTSITVTPSSAALQVGGTVQLVAQALDAEGVAMLEVAITWASTNPQSASVASTGIVTAVAAGSSAISASASGVSGSATVTISDPSPPPSTGFAGIWIGSAELAALPASGSAWTAMKAQADSNCGTPDLANQDQNNNICIMAKALVYARIGGSHYRDAVVAAISSITNAGTYSGTALALGRELAAYVIAADLIQLSQVDPVLDGLFRTKLRALLTTFTNTGPKHLIECNEKRPNNWGTHCGASRAAVAAYLNDTAELARTAQVFRGWLGDRSSYAGFSFGSDLSWQCNAAAPVAVNPAGCTKNGNSIDGVLPDDQRRGGSFSWPPPGENYVYEALQGALAQAVILHRRGHDVWNWENRALLRAFTWLHGIANYPASGDDRWQPHIINRVYGTSFPAPVPAQPGKNVGWTDWTHR